MNIKQWRKDNHVTQIKLANLVGVTLSTVRWWEQGAMKPNPGNMKKLLSVMENYKED